MRKIDKIGICLLLLNKINDDEKNDDDKTPAPRIN